jgi:hypothetical protein
MAKSAAMPFQVCGMRLGSSARATTNSAAVVTTVSSKLTPARPLALTRALDGDEVDPEEQGRRDAVEVPSMRSGASWRLWPMSDAPPARHRASPATVAPAMRLPCTSHAKRMTKIGAEQAKKVALATVVLRIDRCQKNKSPAKARPGEHRGAREAARLGGRPRLLEAHPGIEHRQGQEHAPEGAREGAHVGRRETHEQRRDPHGRRPGT